MKKYLIPALLLIMLLSITVILEFSLQENSRWREYITANLFVEIIGIFLTIIVLNLFLEREREAERKKYEIIAYQQLKKPISNLAMMLAWMIKASIDPTKANATFPFSYQKLFSSEYVVELERFDFRTQAPITPTQVWFYEAPEALDRNFEEINRILGTFAAFLDPSLLQNMTAFEFTFFITTTRQASVVASLLLNQYHFDTLALYKGMGEELKNNLTHLINVIDILNKRIDISISKSFWSETVAPKIGGSRVDESDGRKHFEGIVKKD